jgi:hypothetical protein
VTYLWVLNCQCKRKVTSFDAVRTKKRAFLTLIQVFFSYRITVKHPSSAKDKDPNSVLPYIFLMYFWLMYCLGYIFPHFQDSFVQRPPLISSDEILNSTVSSGCSIPSISPQVFHPIYTQLESSGPQRMIDVINSRIVFKRSNP